MSNYNYNDAMRRAVCNNPNFSAYCRTHGQIPSIKVNYSYVSTGSSYSTSSSQCQSSNSGGGNNFDNISEVCGSNIVSVTGGNIFG